MTMSLNIFIFCLKSVEVLAVLLVLAIGADLIITEGKADTTQKREEPQTPKVDDKPSAVERLLSEAKARLIKAVDRDQEFEAKHRLRAAKEKSAHDSAFFDDAPYVRGFDISGALINRGVRVPTEKAFEYYQKMDELADTQIFANTEEL